MSEYEKIGEQSLDTSFATNTNQARQSPLIQDDHTAQIIQRAGILPGSLTSSDIMQLQSTIGNRAVCQLMQDLSSMHSHAAVKQESKQGGYLPPAGQGIQTPGAEPVQMKMENNTGLPDALKAGVEQLSGIDMSEVRVHYNSDKPAHLGALAYTQGRDIHVAAGQERHLPHEAWHVVQQSQQRVQPTVQMKGAAVNDELGLEREADEKGRQSLKAGENGEIAGLGSIAQDSYKAAGGFNIIQKMDNGEEEEEESIPIKSKRNQSINAQLPVEPKQKKDKTKVLNRWVEDATENLEEPIVYPSKLKGTAELKTQQRIAREEESNSDQLPAEPKQKKDKKKVLNRWVEDATENLEELDVYPSKLKGTAELKTQQRIAREEESNSDQLPVEPKQKKDKTKLLKGWDDM